MKYKLDCDSIGLDEYFGAGSGCGSNIGTGNNYCGYLFYGFGFGSSFGDSLGGNNEQCFSKETILEDLTQGFGEYG